MNISNMLPIGRFYILELFMRILIYITTIISSFLLGAHFFRGGSYGLFLIAITISFMFFIKKRWSLLIISTTHIFAIFEWIKTAFHICKIYSAIGIPSTRAVVIILGVAIFSLTSFLFLQTKLIKDLYPKTEKTFLIIITGLITSTLIQFATTKVSYPILLLERFYPTLGYFEIFILSIYSMFIVEKMLDSNQTQKYRRLIWRIFTTVFFLQLILGLLGYSIFLMTGKLHLPIPTLIIAGPLYRFQLSFMIYLFLASLIISGSAWCSHLCYFGSIDDFIATKGQSRGKKIKHFWKIRVSILVFVTVFSLLLHFLKASTFVALISASIWAIISFFIIFYFSRKTGVMIHCTMFCPIGFLAVTLGKISPFRLKISQSCNSCMACTKVCRYGALSKEDIIGKKVNLNCTLCGDCISFCKHNSLEYHFLNFSPKLSREIFIVIVVILHTSFLAIGRI